MKFQIYESRDWTSKKTSTRKGRWRWRAVASNKKILADSGEAYNSRSNCRRAVKRFIKHVNDSLFEDLEDSAK